MFRLYLGTKGKTFITVLFKFYGLRITALGKSCIYIYLPLHKLNNNAIPFKY